MLPLLDWLRWQAVTGFNTLGRKKCHADGSSKKSDLTGSYTGRSSGAPCRRGADATSAPSWCATGDTPVSTRGKRSLLHLLDDTAHGTRGFQARESGRCSPCARSWNKTRRSKCIESWELKRQFTWMSSSAALQLGNMSSLVGLASGLLP